MLSNLVRVRKQFGVSWFLFQLLIFTFTIPLFFLLSFIDNLLSLRNPFKDFTTASAFSKNVMSVWGYLPYILPNKPYFYKVLD